MSAGAFLTFLLISPYIKPHFSGWGVLVSDLVWSISAVALIIFCALAVYRLFLFPYQTYEEQGEKIKGLNQELDTRAALEVRYRTFSKFIREGSAIQKKCRKNSIPGKRIHEWIGEFEKYLATLDGHYLDDWMDEGEIRTFEEKDERGDTQGDRTLYRTFFYRLAQSRRMRDSWRSSLERGSVVPRETNSTIS
jgi:hypothetical protein